MRWIALLLLGLCFLLPISVGAQPTEGTANITVEATPFFYVAPPEGFSIYYIDDYAVSLNWTKPTDCENILIRVKYGSVPEDRNDGYLVYYGDNTTFIDYNVQLLGPEVPYYRAWCQRADSVWEEVGSTGEANFMSISFLFAILVVLGLVLFVAAFRWKDVLLSYAAALTWMAIGFWWIIDDITNFGLSDPWVQILVFIPFILAFTVLLRLMNTEITNEAKGQRWTEWGAKPTVEKPDRRTEYRKALRERIR